MIDDCTICGLHGSDCSGCASQPPEEPMTEAELGKIADWYREVRK